MIEVSSPPKAISNAKLRIDSFSVGAFRGLTDIKLDNLGSINLLVGDNNAGKTSILEAIAIQLNPFDPSEWYSIVRTREGRTPGLFSDQMSTIDALRWIFPAREADVWGRLTLCRCRYQAHSAPRPTVLMRRAKTSGV